jgi:hypothetical protein
VIITDRFVMLNNPKTGSSFVRAVLKQLHGYPTADSSRLQRLVHRLGLRHDPRFVELILPAPDAASPVRPNQHGRYCQIPHGHRGKEVASVVRDPFARLYSIYRFGGWRVYPRRYGPTIAKLFPAFPDLSFEEYLRMEEFVLERWWLPGRADALQVGRQTIRFIHMFFRDPPGVLARLDAGYLESDRFLEDLPPIRFLQTERLNRELHDFLRDHGYAQERVAFVLEHERVNVTQWQGRGEWTAALVGEVLRRERLLFRILRHLGFHYAPPTPRSSAAADASGVVGLVPGSSAS